MLVLASAIPINDANPTLSLNPPRLSNTLINLPRLPGFEMDFTFDQSKRLRPFEVYQTAIQLMYETVQRGWDEQVHMMVAEQIEGYDVIMLFLNHQSPTASDQLQIGHCVAALYRAITVMTDGVIFCQLRCHLSVFEKQIGALSIAPLKDSLAATIGGGGGNLTAVSKSNLTLETDVATTATLGANSGTVRDAEDARFSITYHFMGRSITSKEVSMVVLEAMASTAPFKKDAECEELDVVSTTGGSFIIIESLHSSRKRFTYGWATRTLRILYQHIIAPAKKWGDVWLEIKYDDVKFGELRMLRGTAATRNGTDAREEE
ncbi:MAG: hypothetical protein LQ349_005894 [Xanthoria aureola]|nr:MAG: hypothetical protein LQ349_005894 [Xanthoria aureola]